MKEFNTIETKWIKEFEAILKRIPNTLEISADYGITSIYNKGAMDNSFKNCGDADNIQYYAEKCYTIIKSPIIPNSNSL